MAERLTDTVVRNADLPDTGQRFIWDSDIKGFALRVTARGSKAFVLDYRARGRQRRMTIGNYPDWSVAAARAAARDLKREVDRGRDPMAERHADRGAPTIQNLWERYQTDYLPRKAVRTQADERSMWQKIILPAIGKMKVTDVTHEDVQALHRQITTKRGTPVRANRTIEVLRTAFNLSIRWKWRPDNPAAGIQWNPEQKRTRYLSQQELARLSMALAEHHERVSADAIRLMMLTGARRGEVLNARWDMFDLGASLWIKPSSHTKQRREHRVPLSTPVLALLARLKEGEMGPYVFPGKSPDQPLTDVKRTWESVCKKAKIEDARIHDLRHAFASLLVSRGASLPLIGALLGHTQVATTSRYAHLYDQPLREAVELVGAAIEHDHPEQAAG